MEVSGRRQVGSDDLCTGILCDPCKGEDEDENAVFYCTVCLEFLCDTCTRSHRRAKQSKHHQLLDRDSMPKQKLTSSESMCSTHNGKLLEYYCQLHDACCCSVCATLEHKQCKIDYIDDIAMEFENSQEYLSLFGEIANLTQQLNNMKQISLKKKHDVGEIHMKFVSEVKKFRSEINQILDSLEQSSLLETQTLRDKDTKSTESASTTCDVIIADLEVMSSNIDTQKKYKQKRQLVISAKKYQNKIKQYDTIIAELTKQCEIHDYAFRPNDTIIQSIKCLNSLGELKKKTNEESKTNIQREVTGPEKTSAPSKSLSLRYVGEVVVNHQTDTEDCCITGGVMLDNNMLALADQKNSSVKLVDVNNNKVISCIKLHRPPWDITRVARDQIVVTCVHNLVFIKVGERLSVMKEVDMDGYGLCVGIVYTNNTLVVCCLLPSCVKVIDLNGRVLKTITTDKKGEDLFNWPYYIAISNDKRTLYVSDSGNHTVTSMDLDGAVQHVYKHDNLKYPRGLAVDIEGNIYIAGFGSNNIHIISPQFTTIQVIQDGTPGTTSPQAVIYCEKDNRLYIGRVGSKSKSVYQIQ